MSSFNSTTRSVFRILLFSVVLLLVLTATLNVVARVSLPMLASYKGSLESRLGQYLGTPVTIGSLSLAWEGVGPVIKADDVSIIESDARLVSVRSVLLDVNLARSILAGGPAINELTLVGADLYLEYSGAGEFTMHGMPLEKSGEANSETTGSAAATAGLNGLSWLTKARRVGLLDTHITLIDVTNGRRLNIQELNLRAENRGDSHQLRLDLSLPGSLGQRMEAGMDFKGSGVQLSETRGQFYINADSLNMNGWRELLSDSLRRRSATGNGDARLDADGSLELWGKWLEGEVTSARGNLAVTDLVSVEQQAPLFERLAFDLAYRNTNPGWKLKAKNITMEREQRSTIVEDLTVQRGSRSSGNWTVAAAGAQMSLQDFSVLPAQLLSAARHPAGQWLSEAAPAGQLSDWRINMSIENGAPSVDARGQFDDLAWQANERIPGIDALSGRIAIDDNEGSVRLRANNMRLDAPKDLAAAVEIDVLDASFDVALNEKQSHVLKGQVAIKEDGVDLNSRISTVLKPGESPHLDLQGRFSIADLSRLPALLPIRELSPVTGRWFDDALKAGRAENGRFILFGQLEDFPFNSKEGVFTASMDLRDGELQSLPDWPLTTEIDARVELNGYSLVARSEQARMDAMTITRAVARIEDLSRPVLKLESTGNSTLESIVAFGNSGPLSYLLKPVLWDVSSTGEATMDVQVRYPFVESRYKDSPFKVNGSLFLNGNDVSFDSAKVALSKVRGAVGFTQTGVRINNLRGQFLGVGA